MSKNIIYSVQIDKGDELLPIGTVVNLGVVAQSVMIYGRKQQQAGAAGVWDYVACPYPQGHLSDESNVFFNHENITKVIFKGFESEGELILRDKIFNATGETKK